jgi:hypothetical protein
MDFPSVFQNVNHDVQIPMGVILMSTCITFACLKWVSYVILWLLVLNVSDTLSIAANSIGSMAEASAEGP